MCCIWVFVVFVVFVGIARQRRLASICLLATPLAFTMLHLKHNDMLSGLSQWCIHGRWAEKSSGAMRREVMGLWS